MTNEDRLRRLQEQKEKAQHKAKEIERKMQSIRAKEQAQERKLDTRRKVLLGALLLEQMEGNETKKREIMMQLDSFLTRNNDRDLFGLASSDQG